MAAQAWRFWRRPVRELAGAAVDGLLTSLCPGCGSLADGLCRPCEAALGRRGDVGCRRCGEPSLANSRRCTTDHRPLRGLAFLVAPFRFAGTGGALVRRFKLDADAGAGRVLARAMRQAWRARTASDWRRALVVAVPLHRQRRRVRGFDQAEWLAGALARGLGLAHLPGALRRLRPTRAQGDPRTTARDRNVAGAFAVSVGEPIGRRQVVLVDDVFTSGATLRECASALREAGAREVAGVVACKS